MRRIIQLLSLSFFTYLFFRASYPLASAIPVDLFLRIDPLNGLVSSIASRELAQRTLPSVLLIVLTLLFGRFFCGYLCPLGTILDLANNLFAEQKRGL